jgi:hypothetical protein
LPKTLLHCRGAEAYFHKNFSLCALYLCGDFSFFPRPSALKSL